MVASKKNQSLSEYRSKRFTDRTPEPFGGAAAPGGSRFVVQQHAARALHYDFRLELDGVLKSWAVPRGPSPNPSDKRLAVRTEDHPLDYADFEGVIPEGNYGAGAVIVWDRGSWQPVEDVRAGFDKGKLLFDLRGYKLRGRWTLVKTTRGEKDWLLIKERDAYVSEQSTDAYPADSVLSGLTVEQLRDGDDPGAAVVDAIEAHGLGPAKTPPRRVKPMLAAAGAIFSRGGWVFEIKYDGYRIMAERHLGEVTLYSRNGNDLSSTFPEIREVVAALPYPELVMDGEVVVHDEGGLPSFSRLQKRGRLSRAADAALASQRLPATYYAFDLPAFGGYDLRALPLLERKALLRRVLPSAGPVRYSEHVETGGEQMYAHVQALGLEGVVAKRADSRYCAGRSKDWVKVNTEKTDDFAVAGYTPPRRGRAGFGALLLAQQGSGGPEYTGRVGTGFRAQEADQIRVQLDRLAAGEALATGAEFEGARWVVPELVASVKFKQRTPDGLLRAPVFVCLRDDKSASECLLPDAEDEELDVIGPAPPGEGGESRRSVAFTNLDKTFWPQDGYTKGDLIKYYERVAPWMLPYLADRPVVLTRYPDGIDGKSFYQKDAPGFVPDWLRTESVWSEGSGREISYFVIEDVESLLYIANMGTVPVHAWLSRAGQLERPDWCVLDLDPHGAPFADVVAIARNLHRLCGRIGLPNYVKSSGSTGLHIVIPLGAQYTYEQSRTLAELLARVVVQELPGIATVVRNPARREGKVYVDFLQNRHGQTIAAPFCARPLPGAPVSMPLRWNEVTPKLDIHRFTISNAVTRMKRLGDDPLVSILRECADLAAALDRLAGEMTGG